MMCLILWEPDQDELCQAGIPGLPSSQPTEGTWASKDGRKVRGITMTRSIRNVFPSIALAGALAAFPLAGLAQNGYPQNGYPQNGYPQNSGYPQTVNSGDPQGNYPQDSAYPQTVNGDQQGAPMADQAPPPIPQYDQPECPGDGYIWTTGYWAYDPNSGYNWVDGAWVLPPYTDALWTPGWWGYGGSDYFWTAGYWGPEVGYYGGINYGFGYFGVGFYGGYWNGGHFWYNRPYGHFGGGFRGSFYNRTYAGFNGRPGGRSFNSHPPSQFAHAGSFNHGSTITANRSFEANRGN